MLNFGSVLIGSQNLKTMAEFYEKILGKPAEWNTHNFYAWKMGSAYLAIGEHSEAKGKAKEPQRVIINFETQEVKEEFEKIRSLGARVIKEPYEFENMRIATFADPDGNYFQVMSPFQMVK